MDAKTGKIYGHDETDKLDEKTKKRLVPIPANEETEVRAMNRRQRRAWASKQRKGQYR